LKLLLFAEIFNDNFQARTTVTFAASASSEIYVILQIWT